MKRKQPREIRPLTDGTLGTMEMTDYYLDHLAARCSGPDMRSRSAELLGGAL